METMAAFETKEKHVMAGAPGCGKTNMGLQVASYFLKNSKRGCVVVLAHGTNLIRQQWIDRAKQAEVEDDTVLVDPLYKTPLQGQKIFVTLPQTLVNRKVTSRVNLLIVDEAHQRYASKQVKDLIKKLKPKKILLLTGTPSYFIKHDYSMSSITLSEMRKHNVVCNPQIQLVLSTYNYQMKEYNSQDNLRKEFSPAKDEENFDLLLAQLTQILQSKARTNPKLYRRFRQISKKPFWKEMVEVLDKTMLVCRSQKQAKRVQDYMEKQGVESIISISDLGDGNEELEEFKTSDKRVFIVVNRGTIGFDYDKLTNVIDMSGTLNINLLFQMLCRIVRPNWEEPNKTKLFIKMANPDTIYQTRRIMNFVLGMAYPEIYNEYKGNFKAMKVVISPKEMDEFEQMKKLIEKMKKELEQLKKYQAGEKKKNPSNRSRSIPKVYVPEVDDCFIDLKHRDRAKCHTACYAELFGNIKPANYWTKEKCIETAKDYSTIGDFKKSNWGAYHAVVTNKWNDDCFSHMDRLTVWTKEACLEIARKCKTRTEFLKTYGSAYNAAKRIGCLDECYSHMESNRKPNGYWTKEKCMKVARTCKSKKEFSKKHPGAFGASKKLGCFEECCKHMKLTKKPMGHWNNKENCIRAAEKCKTRTEFEEKYPAAYKSVSKNGWDECYKHMKHIQYKAGYWTVEKCLKESKKYKIKKDFNKGSPGAFSAAKRLGCFEECCKHMKSPRKPVGYWTKEKCMKVAKKYSTIGEFRKNCRGGAYNASSKNGWLNDIKKLFK